MKKILFLLIAIFPAVAFAQPEGIAITSVSTLRTRLTDLITILFPFLITVAVVIVTVGIIKYIANATDQEMRAEGRNFVIWGVIMIFLMLSVWGFVSILRNTFNIDNTFKTEQIPVLRPIN